MYYLNGPYPKGMHVSSAYFKENSKAKVEKHMEVSTAILCPVAATSDLKRMFLFCSLFLKIINIKTYRRPTGTQKDAQHD